MSSDEMLSFSKKEIAEENLETVPEKVIQNESPFTFIEGPLNVQRPASNETNLVSEVPFIFYKENSIIAPGKGKIPSSVLNNDIYEELSFPFLFPKVNLVTMFLEMYQ